MLRNAQQCIEMLILSNALKGSTLHKKIDLENIKGLKKVNFSSPWPFLISRIFKELEAA